MNDTKLSIITNTNLPEKCKGGGVIGAVIAELDEVQAILAYTKPLARKLNFDRHEPTEIAEAREAVRTTEAYLESGKYAESAGTLNNMKANADDSFMGEQVKLLMGSWPNVAKADLAAFGAALVAELRARHVSRYALAQGFRELRTTLRFLPSIAEVLESVKDANEPILRLVMLHDALPGQMQWAKQMLADEDAKAAHAAADYEARAAAQAEALRAAVVEFFPDAPADMLFDTKLQESFRRARMRWPPTPLTKLFFIDAAKARAAALRAAIHKFFPDAPADMPFEEVLQETLIRAGLPSSPTLLRKLQLIDAAKALAAAEAKARDTAEAEARAAAQAEALRAAAHKVFPDAPADMPVNCMPTSRDSGCSPRCVERAGLMERRT